MRKRYFLGTAAGFSKKMRVEMRMVKGHHEDYVALGQYLVREYGGRQAIPLINGRSAIAAALDNYRRSEWKEKGEVIINGFTCYAVVQGIKAAGFTPVYADIDRKTLNFTIESLEKKVTSRTKAVIVQNTLGNMVDIRAVEEFCRKHKLVLIEDLAHCAGRFYADGREAGKVGEVAVFSFGKEKAVDVCGGGAVVFRDSKMPLMAEPYDEPSNKDEFRARIYPTVGYVYRGLSYVRLAGVFMRLMLKMGLVRRSADGEVDYKRTMLGDFQAKMALEQLKKLKKGGEGVLRDFCFVRDRSEVLRRLEKEGYYFGGFWYEKPVSPERYYEKVHFPEKECPNAVWVAEHIVNLPTYYNKRDLARARKIIEEYKEEVEK